MLVRAHVCRVRFFSLYAQGFELMQSLAALDNILPGKGRQHERAHVQVFIVVFGLEVPVGHFLAVKSLSG